MFSPHHLIKDSNVIRYTTLQYAGTDGLMTVNKDRPEGTFVLYELYISEGSTRDRNVKPPVITLITEYVTTHKAR